MTALPEAKKMSVTVGGKEITFETGRVARQAHGSVLVQCGDTITFSSACYQPEADKVGDFLPMRVDYQEKFSSAGKSAGGFVKREGRPTEHETLVCRLIDRPLRPMFDDGYFCETQVISYVWSYTSEHRPEPLAICGAAAALYLSEIPFSKAVAAVRVGRINGEFILNPSTEEMENSDLDLMLAGTADAVLMIEGFCDFLTEEQVINAIYFGHQSIRDICLALTKWREEVGQPKNRECLHKVPEDLMGAIERIAGPTLEPAMTQTDRAVRQEGVEKAKELVNTELFPADGEAQYEKADVAATFKKLQARYLRTKALNEGIRCDGRRADEVRPITIEQHLLPRAHGSSLFTRGETQAMAVCTLGGASMAQRYEDLEASSARQFYLQYFFPPFSVGEVGRMGPASRREVGHGKLAERALAATLPEADAFPYTIRLESNITESNGSSSMASVCGGCLAMMDAGVPIKRPVSGIAMGLILEGDRHLILSDILGLEDFLGDMDFKITGDAEGITAFQMDIKVEGITPEIMKQALQQANQGRLHILQKMLVSCPKPREDLSQHAPRIERIKINPSKIATVIGPGGKQIRAIIDETGVEIDIDDDGTVMVSSPTLEAIEKAKAIINGLTAEVEIGKTYHGKVTGIVPFGCFVEILPGKEGLCHISEFAHERIADLNEHLKIGDMIDVKVLDINERGQLKLSRKALLAKA